MESRYKQSTTGFRIIRIIGFVILGLAAATIFGLAFGYFVMKLWNWIMPELFGLTTITFWQAFGIVILGRLIFGNIGHCHDKHSDSKRKHSWRSKMYARCKDMDWKHYNEYWEKEGEQGFKSFVEEKKKDSE